MIISKDEAIRLLSDLPEHAKINTRTKPDGGLMFSVVVTKTDLIKEKFPALVGQPITVTEAAEKHGVHRNTILNWVKNGYIKVIKSGYQMTVDAAYVAYCAEAYKTRKNAGFGFSGAAPILDKNGYLYQLKHPDRAIKRQTRKN